MKNYFASVRQAITAVRYLPWALNLVWKAARGWTIAWFGILIAQGIVSIASVYLTRDLVNRLVQISQAKDEREIRAIIWLVVLLAAVLLLSQALRGLGDWARTAQTELVQDYISDRIHVKASELDLSFYDDPTYYDRLHRARIDANNRPIALLENIGSLLQNSITLVAMAGVLLPFGVWVPLSLVLSSLPALAVTFSYTLRQHQWRIRTTQEQRRTRYYDWILTVREAAAELRLFGLSEHFRYLFQKLRHKLRSEQMRLIYHRALADLLASGIALSLTGLVMGWMVWQTLQA